VEPEEQAWGRSQVAGDDFREAITLEPVWRRMSKCPKGLGEAFLAMGTSLVKARTLDQDV
jgi:hypothetical protein